MMFFFGPVVPFYNRFNAANVNNKNENRKISMLFEFALILQRRNMCDIFSVNISNRIKLI